MNSLVALLGSATAAVIAAVLAFGYVGRVRLRKQLWALEAHLTHLKESLDVVRMQLGVVRGELSQEKQAAFDAMSQAPAPLPPDAGLSDAAIKMAADEQEHHEGEHHVPFRDDQRIQSVQQRLSRVVGLAAFQNVVRGRVEKELRKRGLVRRK